MATNFEDLGIFLSQDISRTRKTELVERFNDKVLALFGDAWRLEQQGRFDEALQKYQKIVLIMGDHDLATIELALTKIQQLERR